MATAVVMPQMGESIAEGTIVRWIKKVGDQVDRDEPLFEISTDKVDAEIPSPAAGVLTEIRVREGETVPVNAVVGTIGAAGELAVPADEPGARPTTSVSVGPVSTAPASLPAASEPAAATPARTAAPASGEARRPATAEDLRRQKSSPLVRRIAREHQVDIGAIPGSGVGGRVTKHDILGFLDRGEPAPAGRAVDDPSRVEIKPLSPVRRKIAEHMVMSRRTSAHVHSVFHVNFSVVERIRQQKKADYERDGLRLTYMAFIASATADALRRFPLVNASLDGGNVIYRKDINLGIAVATDAGLLVPVVRNADALDVRGLAHAIADVADRTRRKQLRPEEVHGGTFTITNPGQFGSQFGMPIINQPQVAILGVGTIEKRPVVVDDAIGIRTMAYLTLGFDHRLVDGAVGDQFMAHVKDRLEQFDPAAV